MPAVAAMPDFSSAAAYDLVDVSQSRGGRALLQRITLRIPAHGLTVLIGPSGCGKTTLLRLLNRLDDPVSGVVRFFGQPINAHPVRALRLRAGFVFQAPVMFAGTVSDNLSIALQLAGEGKGQTEPGVRMERIAAALRLAGLAGDYAARDAGSLSGGEKQRVALARALIHRPEVLLLDEPTAALDPEAADGLLDTLRTLQRTTAQTIVMVTHRLREVAAVGTHAVMLDGGVVIEAGSAEQVLKNPQHERSRVFLLAGDAGNSDAAQPAG